MSWHSLVSELFPNILKPNKKSTLEILFQDPFESQA